jgi:hypothetical protein
MKQFYVLTQDPKFIDVSDWITENNIHWEMHLNRTRFLVPDGPVMTDFLLRFIQCCPEVDEDDPAFPLLA